MLNQMFVGKKIAFNIARGCLMVGANFIQQHGDGGNLFREPEVLLSQGSAKQ